MRRRIRIRDSCTVYTAFKYVKIGRISVKTGRICGGIACFSCLKLYPRSRNIKNSA